MDARILCNPMAIALAASFTACANGDRNPHESPVVAGEDTFTGFELAGNLENNRITEASGLAGSHRDESLYWIINDGDSPPELFLIGAEGQDHGSVAVEGAENIDWEDLASFELDGRDWLMIADIGDNASRRESVALYILEEPAADAEASAEVAWRIDFTYPGGAQDAEGIAVDAANERVLVLSKRRIPAMLYGLPLRPEQADTIVTATPLGEITSIEQPTQADIDHAPLSDDWYWQPTGMDFAHDGSAAAILTYDSIWYFAKQDGEDWLEAFRAEPLRLRIDGVPGPEAIAFDSTGTTILVTAEKRNAPLFRYEIQR